MDFKWKTIGNQRFFDGFQWQTIGNHCFFHRFHRETIGNHWFLENHRTPLIFDIDVNEKP